MEVPGHPALAGVFDAGGLVPLVVVVVEFLVELGLYLLGGELGQALLREEDAHLHLHAAGPVLQVELRRGEVAARDLRIKHRDLEALEQMPAAHGAGLVRPGDAAHPLRQEDDAPALPDYPQDLADGVRLLCEVLLRHGLHLRQHAVQVAAEKLVVAHDEVEGVRPEGRGREHIVLARGVV